MESLICAASDRVALGRQNWWWYVHSDGEHDVEVIVVGMLAGVLQGVPLTTADVGIVHEAEAGVTAAITGAAVGAIAGPPGIAPGAVIGGIARALASGAR